MRLLINFIMNCSICFVMKQMFCEFRKRSVHLNAFAFSSKSLVCYTILFKGER